MRDYLMNLKVTVDIDTDKLHFALGTLREVLHQSSEVALMLSALI